LFRCTAQKDITAIRAILLLSGNKRSKNALAAVQFAKNLIRKLKEKNSLRSNSFSFLTLASCDFLHANCPMPHQSGSFYFIFRLRAAPKILLKMFIIQESDFSLSMVSKVSEKLTSIQIKHSRDAAL